MSPDPDAEAALLRVLMPSLDLFVPARMCAGVRGSAGACRCVLVCERGGEGGGGGGSTAQRNDWNACYVAGPVGTVTAGRLQLGTPVSR